uniref:Uncharacterized protein n=1 Tax=Solanum lycopersicum TaxID=4081 RepID=A0A3Q7HTT3_SOLLC
MSQIPVVVEYQGWLRINIKSWLSPRFGLGRVSSQNRDRNRDVVESRVPVQECGFGLCLGSMLGEVCIETGVRVRFLSVCLDYI